MTSLWHDLRSALRRILRSEQETQDAIESADARQALIAEKEAVIAEIARTRAELARVCGSRPDGRRETDLEAHLQALMAEEHRLRLLIDRSPQRKT